MNKTEKQLGILLGDILLGKEIKSDEKSALSLLMHGFNNNVSHFLFDSLEKYIPQQKIPFSILNNEIQLTYLNVAQLDAWEKVKTAFEEKGIDVIMLKGIYNRELFQNPDLRTMGDIDLLYKPGDRRKIRKIFIALGFEFEGEDRNHEKYFCRETCVSFELHHTLKMVRNYKAPFYDRLFENAVNYKGFKHIFRLSDEDNYLFTLIHLQKHLSAGDYSLKRLCDYYVISKTVDTASPYILQNEKELLADTFAGELEKVCKIVFEGVESENTELADSFFDNFDSSEAQRDEKNSKDRIKSFLGLVFPVPAQIYISYPLIEKHKILLPFGYLFRLFQGFTTRKKNVEIKADSAKSEKSRAMKEFEIKHGISD